MKCYLDSSVVLRVLLGQQPQFSGWGTWQEAYSSRLMRCEVSRTLDRLRLAGALDDAKTADCIMLFREIADHLGQIPLTESILAAVEAPFSTTIGTMDAIHVASAQAYQSVIEDGVVFVTHDNQQAIAARAAGFDVHR